MFAFDTGLIDFFYTLDIMIYDSVDRSRLVVAIFIRVIIGFGVGKVRFISKL